MSKCETLEDYQFKRRSLINTYYYLKKVLPRGYMNIHIRHNPKLRHEENHLPSFVMKNLFPKPKQYKIKSNLPMAIILTNEDKDPKIRNTNKSYSVNNRYHTINKLSSGISSENTGNDQVIDQGTSISIMKHSKDSPTMPNISQNTFFNLKSIKLNKLLGAGKDMISNPIKEFHIKRNLYLPTVVENMKNTTPRYNREKPNGYMCSYQTKY